MFRRVKVFGGVLVFGRVATADVSALEADSQMDPAIAQRHAVFTNLCGGLQILRVFYVFTDGHATIASHQMHHTSQSPAGLCSRRLFS